MPHESFIRGIELLSWTATAFLTITAAFFQFQDTVQTRSSRGKHRNRHRAAWKLIRTSKVRRLVPIAIAWSYQFAKDAFLRLAVFFLIPLIIPIGIASRIKDDSGRIKDTIEFGIVAAAWAILFVYPAVFLLFIRDWVLGGTATAAALLVAVHYRLKKQEKVSKPKQPDETIHAKNTTPGCVPVVLFLYLVFVFPAVAYSILETMLIVEMSPVFTLLFVCLAAPVVACALVISLLFVMAICNGFTAKLRGISPSESMEAWKEHLQIAMTAGFITASISLVMTFSAFILGDYLAPSGETPHIPKFVVLNICTDFATVWITASILRSAILGSIPWLRAIAYDVLASAVLACTSVWIGLHGTQYEYSFTQTLWLLVGRSINGTWFRTDGVFLAMHTTFIPTMAYLSVVLFLFLMRFVAIPVRKILARTQLEEVHPHRMFAALFGVLAAFTGGIALLIEKVSG